MRSLEQEKPSADKLPIETKRALINAESLAREENTNIGIGYLLKGVLNEMGSLHAANILIKNGIKIDIFNKAWAQAVRDENLRETIATEPMLTPLSQKAICYAAEHSKSKKTKELLPSDLLLAIAKAVKADEMASLRNQQATASTKILGKMEPHETYLIKP